MPSFNVFTLSFLILLVEVTLVRVLDVVLNPAVSWMCLTIAMLGFGLSPLVLNRVQRLAWFSNRCLLFILSFLLLCIRPFVNHLDLSGAQGIFLTLSQYVLLFSYLVLIFLAGSICLLRNFAQVPDQFARLYCFDLLGGAAGCLAAAALLGSFNPGQIFIISGSATLMLALALNRKPQWIGFGCLGIIVFAIYLTKTDPLESEFVYQIKKRFSFMLNQPDRIEQSFWTPISKIDIVKVPGGARWILYDGGELNSTIYAFDGDYESLRRELPRRMENEFWTPGVLASHFLKADLGSRVLAIGAAGGQEIKAGLLFGAREVDVAEIIGELIDLGKTRYADINGEIFLRSEVKAYAQDGRAFLRARREKSYDIIQLNSVHASSSFGSVMGAMQTNSLFTVEAFKEYFSHLANDGVLHINFIFYPRLVTTLAAAWKELGLKDFRSHVVVIESTVQTDQVTTVLIKKSPWTAPEMSRLRTLFSIAESAKVSYRFSEDPLSAKDGFLHDDFFLGSETRLLHDLRYRTSPVTDDRPFFKFLRKTGFTDASSIPSESYVTPQIKAYLDGWRIAGLPGDVFSLLLTGAALVVIVASLALMMRLRRNTSERSHPALPIYFVCIGFGFIVLEILLIYETALIVGSPHLALTTVLAALLTSAGLGSLVSGTRPFLSQRSGLLMGLIGTGLVPVVIQLNTSLKFVIAGLPQSVQTLVVCLFLLPIGFCLGFAFPCGVRFFLPRTKQAMSSAWLMNGIGSIIGGYIAVAVSLFFGFKVVAALGCLSYFLAFVTLKLAGRSGAPP